MFHWVFWILQIHAVDIYQNQNEVFHNLEQHMEYSHLHLAGFRFVA